MASSRILRTVSGTVVMGSRSKLTNFRERVTGEVEADIPGNRETSRSRFAMTRQAVGDGKAGRRD